MIYIIYITLFSSFLFCLSDEQIEKIKLKTEKSNYAPNFTLSSIEDRDFSKPKNTLSSIFNSINLFKKNNQKYPESIKILVDSSYILIDEQVNDNWNFEIQPNYLDIIAKNKLDNVQISYNGKEDSFSFIIPNEDVMSIKETVTLDSLKGKVVLINFWATWCGPCRMEIPDFNELYKTYNDKGLEILSISISDSYQQLIKFKNAYNIFYPILYGDQRTMMKIQRDYGGIHSIPMSFLIDKKGEIIRVYPGAIIKQFDPNIYTDLILHIEDALLR